MSDMKKSTSSTQREVGNNMPAPHTSVAPSVNRQGHTRGIPNPYTLAKTSPAITSQHHPPNGIQPMIRAV